MRTRDLVAYTGPDDEELLLWHGQPGRVVDATLHPHEVTVSFVNGPSLCLPPAEVERLDPATYRERVHRVLRLEHPVRDGVGVPRFWAELEPWEDDDVARGPAR